MLMPLYWLRTEENKISDGGYPQWKLAANLINHHAQLVTKKISINLHNPWMTPAILTSKRYCRYLERIWRRNLTALNIYRLTKQTHLCNWQMSKAKLVHYSKIIAEHSGDYGSLEGIQQNLTPLPSNTHSWSFFFWHFGKHFQLVCH